MSAGKRMRVGAIDIGSNSIRLLVADLADDPWTGALETVTRAGEPCRLGRGLQGSGQVLDELVERAGVVAAEFRRRARSLGAVHVLAGATAALRLAANGAEAARRIGERAGLPVQVLSGDEEAQLVYQAVVLGLGARVRDSQCVVFDLGGGSTEIVSGVGARAGRWASLPFGAVSLTERLLPVDPPDAHTLAEARARIREELMHGAASMPGRSPLLAGVGGTVTVLASMDRELAVYEPSLIEGWWLPRERAQALVARIVSAGSEARRALPVMGEGRADIVAAGALVVEALLERFDAAGLLCSTQGLRYGLARRAAAEWVAKGPEVPR